MIRLFRLWAPDVSRTVYCGYLLPPWLGSYVRMAFSPPSLPYLIAELWSGVWKLRKMFAQFFLIVAQRFNDPLVWSPSAAKDCFNCSVCALPRACFSEPVGNKICCGIFVTKLRCWTFERTRAQMSRCPTAVLCCGRRSNVWLTLWLRPLDFEEVSGVENVASLLYQFLT